MSRTGTTGRRGSHSHPVDEQALRQDLLNILPGLLNELGIEQESVPGRAIWGRIIGRITDQKDLIDLIEQSGGGITGVSLPVSETVVAGMVNVHVDTGEAKVRQAVATGWATRATGYIKAAASTGSVEVFPISGVAEVFSGLDLGVRQYLSATSPGQLSTTYPATADHIVQPLGISVGAAALLFAEEDPFVVAGA